MSDPYLLDTNAAIALLNYSPEMIAFLDRAEEIYLSSVVLGELYFGAHKSKRVQENIDKVEQVATRYPVLYCDADAAREYGVIAYQQRAKGRKIPYHDIWIAALARQHNLTLLTRDSDFDYVEGINLVTW
jgi:tRNA(fMet)-specific endonuclease VapC